MPEKYYSINQIAELFGVTRKAVYDWMDAGKLEYVIVGARRRITQTALDAFIQRRGTSTSKPEGAAEKEVMPHGELALQC